MEIPVNTAGTKVLLANEKSPTVPFIRKNNRNPAIIVAFEDLNTVPTYNAINPIDTVTADFKIICT